ncbi:hypothetical protein AMK59_3745 [Oryctes borbonicus]|uniref:DUF1279 domain-containing protein n=1 Tax=Oryctes borbonicus TaxID=1629725 RepID=A0A0T6B5G8_9SCAR|nr:hypothetical protein AMK59_3745 [Oryctes borbonicus]
MLNCNRLVYWASKQVCSRQLQRNVTNSYARFTCINSNECHNVGPIFTKELSISLKSSRLTECSTSPSSMTIYRCYSDKGTEKPSAKTLSNSEKLKKAVKEYGSTVIVFHVGISLLSLGFFYALVSSGVDLTSVLQYMNLSNDRINNLTGNAGTFVIAYAIHKIFVPVRIGITLTATPFIVRHLRKIGWLKK